MELLKYLINTFGYNEPIMSYEISYKNYSKAWINKELTRLCESGNLIRFEKGIYYIPKNTSIGPSKLNPQKVIEKKYISDGKGYYSGTSFLNKIGLSTQVPNLIEIYTNEEKSKVREVRVGSQHVILRRARTPIDEKNVDVQSFLELMNYVPSSFFDEKKRRIVLKYIKKLNISRKDISEYVNVFPDKAIRTLVESEVIYDIAQW